MPTPAPAALAPAPAPAQPEAFVPPVASLVSGRIAFSSDRDGNLEIYVVNADGSGQTWLANSAGYADGYPAWSPDGTKFAFTSDHEGNDEIYVMNADGSGQIRLTKHDDSDWLPAWSPDGAKIAFESYREGNFEIYVMNADGNSKTRLTYNAGNNGLPAWSPDGAKIAFGSYREGNFEIYVMNADGTGQIRLTYNADSDRFPAWSPDGAKIAFESNRDGNSEIYMMNVDGTGQTNLTNNPTADYGPAWTSIALAANTPVPTPAVAASIATAAAIPTTPSPRPTIAPTPEVGSLETTFFTFGSHKDDVARLQGTPTGVRTYSFSGTEIWSYGFSTVEFDLTTGRVRVWSNVGDNLKVSVKPGPNITESTLFTFGSHKDDVARIQGTPTSVRTYRGTEIWSYGFSTVEFDLTTGRVRVWSNSGDNLKVSVLPAPTPAPILRSGEEEARDKEFQNVIIAVGAMMIDNGISSIPNLNNGGAGGCTTGTNQMSAWPDITSDWTGGANGNKATDPDDNSYAGGDKAGFLLYTHDILGNNAATTTVKYLTVATSAFCYTSAADGTITQYKKDGTQTNP